MQVQVTVAAPGAGEKVYTLDIPVGPATIRVGAVRVLTVDEVKQMTSKGWVPST